VFLGLFTVFLSRRREEGQRVQCMYHLKRIGEGVLAFHQAHKGAGTPGFFPPARIADGYATWAVLLAPYIGEEQALDKWGTGRPFLDQDEKVRRTMVPLYFCPARPRSFHTGEDGALGDYAGAAGDGDPRFEWTGPNANGAIILGDVLERDQQRILRWRGRVSLADLKRGLSNTLLVGEKHVPSRAHGQTQFGDGSIYDGRFPANATRLGGPDYPLAQSPEEPFRHNFGSAHPGFCQFLVADGSVSAYATTLSPALLGKLIVCE